MSIILVVAIRSFIAFFALLVLVRLMGKQQLAELTFFDYVVGITIGSIAATLSVAVNQNTLATLTGMALWTILPIILGFLSLHNVWFRKVIEGEAIILIKNGKILERNLRKVRLSIDELLALLRNQGVFNIVDVEFALFETNGALSIQKKSQKRNLTPGDLSIATQYEGLSVNLIKDGILLSAALKSLNLSRAWLQHQLEQAGIPDLKLVSLAQLDTQGNLYIDLEGDGPCYTINTKNSGEKGVAE